MIQDMIQDTEEQPDEEVQRVRSARVLSAGVSVPMAWGSVVLMTRSCVRQPGGKQPAPRTSEMFTEASPWERHRSLAPLPDPLLFWREVVGLKVPGS